MNDEKVTFQHEFCQELPYEVQGTKEYEEYQKILEGIDQIIIASNIEKELYRYLLQTRKGKKTKKRKQYLWRLSQQIVRCGVARKLRGESLRVFSCSLAESIVLQRFCRLVEYGKNKIRVPNKSTLSDYEKMVPERIMRKMIALVLKGAQTKEDSGEYGLEEEISLEDCYLDTTCLEAHVHYPVDWVLLKDATRTLMKAVTTIRNRGLRNRMPQTPDRFISRMNSLAMKMSYESRKKDGKKKQKEQLRKMKKLLKKVEQHALKHRNILEARWEETELAEGEKDQIVGRLNNVIEQLPLVVKLAHKRIISEKKIENEEKILSLYEHDIHIVIRKKAGKEIEFGNVLSLLEQKNGLIVDYGLYEERVPSDTKILPERVESVEMEFGAGVIKSLTTDRGFNSKANKKYLRKKEIVDNTCPRIVEELEERIEEDACFMVHQKRRAQTEARIGIFKNVFLGSPFRNKGFEYRQGGVGWCVLGHNLWVLARMAMRCSQQNEHEKRLAA